MSLHLLRGRELKPPSRSDRSKPLSSTGRQSQDVPPIPRIGGARKGKPILRFPVSAETRAFYRRFFPDTSPADWNDWHWQFRARIRTLEDLSRVFRLSADEASAVARHEGALPVGITPYYTSVMGLDDPSEPLRRTHIMTGDEYVRVPGEADDLVASGRVRFVVSDNGPGIPPDQRELVFDRGVAVEVGEGEAAVDFGLVRVLRREVGVDFVLGV